jgi:hypothetical protein
VGKPEATKQVNDFSISAAGYWDFKRKKVDLRVYALLFAEVPVTMRKQR